jgi:uncharacterized membrane protein
MGAVIVVIAIVTTFALIQNTRTLEVVSDKLGWF